MREQTKDELISFINETVNAVDLPVKDRNALKATLRSYVQAIPLNEADDAIADRVFKEYIKASGHHICCRNEWDAWMEKRAA